LTVTISIDGVSIKPLEGGRLLEISVSDDYESMTAFTRLDKREVNELIQELSDCLREMGES